MRFLSDTPPPFELTYGDVFMVPSLSDVSSRLDVDLTTTDGLGTTIPLVVANMTAVAGRRMAETVARRGGMAVLPQDVPVDILEQVVAYVKASHPIYETPITLSPHHTIADALGLVNKRAHGAVIVVGADDEPLGIFTEADAAGYDRFTQLQHVMSRDLVCIEAGTPPEVIFERLEASRVSAAPVVERGRLLGVVTRK
jgi:IMP dehydrogenase